MGYQVVTITLKDGRRVDNVTVIGGVISSLPPGAEGTFTEDDIEDILVTHASRGTQRVVK